MHRVEEILQSAETALTGLALTGDRIERDRVYTPPELPALSLNMAGERPSPGPDHFTHIDSQQDVDVLLHVKDDNYSSVLLEIKAQVFEALKQNHALGLAYVHEIRWVGDSEPSISKEAEKPVATVTMRFSIRYRHSYQSKEG